MTRNPMPVHDRGWLPRNPEAGTLLAPDTECLPSQDYSLLYQVSVFLILSNGLWNANTGLAAEHCLLS